MLPRRPTTRASRLVVAEDLPSTRPPVARGPGSKLRPRPGLSRAAHDPNVAKSNNSASGTSSKNLVKKEAIATAESATTIGPSTTTGAGSQPVKRKREPIGDVPAKTVKSRLPVAGDKENRHKHRTTAYVEIIAPPRTRPGASSSTVPEPANAERRIAGGSAAVRSRTRVVKEEVKENVKEEVLEDAATPVDDAMMIDEDVPPVRLHRRPVSRTLPEKHVSKRRRTSSPGPEDKVAPILNDLGNHAPLPSLDLSDHDHALAVATAQADEIKWDDLDKEDEGDPLMVSEYVVEIFHYLQRLERSTMPNPNYIDNQKDLAWKMRGILMDWLIQVHSRFRLLPETLFLAVNIIDRFLSARTVSLVRLQLVGITAMFIAAKYEEIMAPSVVNFIYCSDSTYGEKDILDAEKYILRSLDWNLSYPNPINFLRRSSKADGYDLQVRTIAKYLVEIACVEWKLLPHPPSCIAAAAMWLARLILEKEEWTPNMEHYSGYDEASLLPAAQLMLTYILRAVRHESFYKKYAAKKYMKVSAYARDWAWAKFGVHEVLYDEEGESSTGLEEHKPIVHAPTSVLLAVELPRLREEARRKREDEARELEDQEGELPVVPEGDE